MNKQEQFIDEVNKVLAGVHLKQLDESLNGKGMEYAKEIISRIHQAFISVYGMECLYEGVCEFVQMPAIICGRNTGHLALGVVTIDMESSGEHWGTFFLTPLGVLEQGNPILTPQEKEYLNKEFIPYDYWYTPKVEGDIHVNFMAVPKKISELLEVCKTEPVQEADNHMDMNM